jgi:hypothetical protein
MVDAPKETGGFMKHNSKSLVATNLSTALVRKVVVAGELSMKRKLIATVFALIVSAANAPAQSPAATNITGVYNGTYYGPEGPTTFTLSLTEQGEGRGRSSLTGVFTSQPAGSSDGVVATNELTGSYFAPKGGFQLNSSNMRRTVPPGQRTMLFINGAYHPDAGQLSGTIQITRGRPFRFAATRDAGESAKLASVSPTPTASSAAPTRPRAVAPVRPQTATPPVAQAVAPTLPPLDAPKLSAPADITGIFSGNCIVGKASQPLRLQLEKSGNGDLRGIFTSYFPKPPHRESGRYTMRGSYDPSSGKVKLEPAQQMGTAYSELTGLEGTFDPSTGRLAGNLTAGKRGPFEVVRDEAETEEVATAMNGVYTSTYLYQCVFPGPSVGFKFSLKGSTNGTVTGFLTMNLPPELGSRATFKLDGTYNMDNQLLSHETPLYHNQPLSLKATAWGPPAPSDFVVQKIVCRVHPGPETMSCTFYAKCPPVVLFPARAMPAPADLDRVMATQCEEATNQVLLAQSAKLVAAADEAKKQAQVAQREAARHWPELIKAAAPAQLASKDLVRKSKAYWDNYKTDLIREIFDGGFGDDIGDDKQFKLLFTGYVEAFSQLCRDALPAKHETVSMAQTKVTKDQYGSVIQRETLDSWTVDCDSRFAPYYRQYAESLLSMGQGLATAIGILSHRESMTDNADPVLDIERFFTTEKCGSAAMRQFTENLLRAAAGDLSLQQAGEKIAGAAAETDKNLPPGRYARFVDGCNGWYRDPANARFRTGHASAWCQCLGEKYRFSMSPDEQYYYANDFGPRFRAQIAQPNSTDPEWSRLHKATEDCQQ